MFKVAASSEKERRSRESKSTTSCMLKEMERIATFDNDGTRHAHCKRVIE